MKHPGRACADSSASLFQLVLVLMLVLYIHIHTVTSGPLPACCGHVTHQNLTLSCCYIHDALSAICLLLFVEGPASDHHLQGMWAGHQHWCCHLMITGMVLKVKQLYLDCLRVLRHPDWSNSSLIAWATQDSTVLCWDFDCCAVTMMSFALM
jgi:hypothetical protein